jgi:hypothetical protein
MSEMGIYRQSTLHQLQTVEAANRDNRRRHPDENISMPKSHFGVERQSTHATAPPPRDNKTTQPYTA